MSKKLLNLLLVIMMLAVFVPTTLAAPPAQEGQDYVVVADDWLSKLADKYLGNPMAYPAIVEYTNQKHAEDASYAEITDPDLIEIGWKVYIPSAEEAAKLVAEAPPEEVLIGAIYPLTGGLAATGEDLKAGVELAVEIVNGEYPDLNLPLAAEAGLPNFGGAKVKVIFGDHEASAEKGMSEAERLITEEGVVALAGCYNSSVTLTASQAAERLGIPFLNPESTSPMLTERGFKYFFRTTPHDRGLAENFFKFLDWLKEEKGLEVKKVAILNENTLWGTDVATLETEFAEQYGYELVESIAYPKEATDMTSEVQKLKASGAEAVLQSSYVSDAILSMKTYKDLDYNPQGILAMDAGFIVSEFVETLGENANYIVSREVWTLDLATAKPMINDVNELYEERYGRNMEGNSARAFTGVLTLCDALNRAGSLEPEAIQKALLETDIPADMTIMPWGVKFDPVTHQNVLGTGIIVQIQDGKYYTVWPVEVASKEIIWPMPKWDER